MRREGKLAKDQAETEAREREREKEKEKEKGEGGEERVPFNDIEGMLKFYRHVAETQSSAEKAREREGG